MFKEINERKLKKRKKGVMLVFSFQNLFIQKEETQRHVLLDTLPTPDNSHFETSLLNAKAFSNTTRIKKE